MWLWSGSFFINACYTRFFAHSTLMLMQHILSYNFIRSWRNEIVLSDGKIKWNGKNVDCYCYSCVIPFVRCCAVISYIMQMKRFVYYLRMSISHFSIIQLLYRCDIFGRWVLNDIVCVSSCELTYIRTFCMRTQEGCDGMIWKSYVNSAMMTLKEMLCHWLG